jgi:hypothetical protein
MNIALILSSKETERRGACAKNSIRRMGTAKEFTLVQGDAFVFKGSVSDERDTTTTTV